MAWVTVKVDSRLGADLPSRTGAEERFYVGQEVGGGSEDVECLIECTDLTVADQVRDALNGS